MNAQSRSELLDLIHEVSLEKRAVVLASGKESNFYLDLRQTLMRPRGVALAGQLVLERLCDGIPVDAVGGMAVGAVPLVSAVLAAADQDPRFTKLLGFFVRKEAKKHGMARQLEGGFKSGQRVVLVEDTTTTGGSTLQAMEIVREAGGIVERVICLVDRGEGAIEAFRQRGVTLEPLFNRSDLRLD
ncbi:MAG: orotate phosphoribosyltransferase [Planctomycetota bacterium]|jgi:orotate phosphoribosyltransferase